MARSDCEKALADLSEFSFLITFLCNKGTYNRQQSDLGLNCPLTELLDTTECLERKCPDVTLRMCRMII